MLAYKTLIVLISQYCNPGVIPAAVTGAALLYPSHQSWCLGPSNKTKGNNTTVFSVYISLVSSTNNTRDAINTVAMETIAPYKALLAF